MMEPTTLEVMRKQEDKYYSVRGDYLCHHEGSSITSIKVDYANRESMTEWSYKVIDFLSFSPETVEIAMNYFDRFLLTTSGSDALKCSKLFQLASMACLYLSIKIHEEVVLDSKFMANLSNGLFNSDQVERMELQVLTALQWWVNPPTALAFIREYLKLLPPSVSKEMKEKTLTLCEPQIQISVIDYNLSINAKASTVALFAVMNALKVLGMEPVLLSHVGSLLSYASRTDHASIVREDIQATLFETIVDFTELACSAAAAAGAAATGITCGAGMSVSHKDAISNERATFNESPCGVFS